MDIDLKYVLQQLAYPVIIPPLSSSASLIGADSAPPSMKTISRTNSAADIGSMLTNETDIEVVRSALTATVHEGSSTASTVPADYAVEGTSLNRTYSRGYAGTVPNTISSTQASRAYHPRSMSAGSNGIGSPQVTSNMSDSPSLSHCGSATSIEKDGSHLSRDRLPGNIRYSPRILSRNSSNSNNLPGASNMCPGPTVSLSNTIQTLGIAFLPVTRTHRPCSVAHVPYNHNTYALLVY